MSNNQSFDSLRINPIQPNSAASIIRLITILVVALTINRSTLRAESLPQFDFTQAGETTRWQASNDVAPLKAGPDGMLITITGDDPFIEGPAADFVSTKPIHLRIRLKSETAGFAQLFWFTDQVTEDQSTWFAVHDHGWTDVCVPLPPLGKGTSLRFDPPGTSGTCTVAWMFFEESGKSGITQISATSSEMYFTVAGLTGDTEIVELQPYQNLSDAVDAPVVHRGSFNGGDTFSIPRFDGEGDMKRDRLYSAFVPLQSRPNFGKIPVAPACFVQDFDDLSQYKVPFPNSTSKKGLQVQMPDDALKLKIQHAALNVSLSGLVDLTRSPANLQWMMDGETYYFNRQYVESLPVKSLSDTGCVVALILLATQTGNPQIDALMLHPGRTAKIPNGITAFNSSTSDGLRHYKACLEFLADRYSRPHAAFGRVANYIVGNEVNSHWEWYNMGLVPGEIVVADYERSVRVAQTAVRKFSSSARVYLSLEHHWTMPYVKDLRKSLPGRKLIEEFNRRAQLGGNFDWNLAFHPYPENLFEPRTWLDKTAIDSPDSPRITFKNLEQLTDFFLRPDMLFHNRPRRIILSEQGFHSDNTEEGDLAQAAAYCYAWQKVNRLDGIDSFILHRHVDHAHEGGLNLGLWCRQPNSIADPSTPRPMYEVFQKADTPDWEAAFQFALHVIGIKSWDEIVTKP